MTRHQPLDRLLMFLPLRLHRALLLSLALQPHSSSCWYRHASHPMVMDRTGPASIGRTAVLLLATAAYADDIISY